MTSLWDVGNGLFEAIGAVCIWANVRRLWLDRVVRGVDWRVTVFFWGWGVWNLFYYPALDQWFSAVAGGVLALGNSVWVVLHIWLSRKARSMTVANRL